ncbi:unnamed protein product [Rotaria magnacalcarata]|uniref:F-box domain-containing protein n=2 Tax=Rotaria magnacalcarata TaxID=392030 RepID=A0A816ZBF7_9BILA|nr:unnamed protein product [Rotaria magnacalcarata]
MHHSLLDILPVELLYNIFTYFWAHEILFTFSNVSPCIDAALLSYASYQVNFKSILKTRFDLVCRTLQPDHIISLTLSGLDDTPKQCKIFMAHFRAEEFSKLRLFTLIKINKQGMKKLVSFIKNLNSKCQISLDDCDIHKIVYVQAMSQVTRLRISDSQQVDTYSLFGIFLHPIVQSSTHKFGGICLNVSKLQSLAVHLINVGYQIVFAFQLPQLTRLVLKIESEYLID